MAKKKRPKKKVKKAPSTPNGKPKAMVGYKELTIDHVFPPDQTAIFANHMVVQNQGPEFHVLFFEIDPPLVLKNQEIEKRMQEMESVEAKCVARIVVSSDRMPAVIKALTDNYAKFEAMASGDVERVPFNDSSLGEAGE